MNASIFAEILARWISVGMTTTCINHQWSVSCNRKDRITFHSLASRIPRGLSADVEQAILIGAIRASNGTEQSCGRDLSATSSCSKWSIHIPIVQAIRETRFSSSSFTRQTRCENGSDTSKRLFSLFIWNSFLQTINRRYTRESFQDHVMINVCGDRYQTHRTTLELDPKTLLGDRQRRTTSSIANSTWSWLSVERNALEKISDQGRCAFDFPSEVEALAEIHSIEFYPNLFIDGWEGHLPSLESVMSSPLARSDNRSSNRKIADHRPLTTVQWWETFEPTRSRAGLVHSSDPNVARRQLHKVSAFSFIA